MQKGAAVVFGCLAVLAAGCGGRSGDDAGIGGQTGVTCDDGVWRVVVPPTRQSRLHPQAAAFDNEVIVFGGLDLQGPSGAIGGWRLDVTMGELRAMGTAGAPAVRNGPAMAAIDGSLYLWGGLFDTSEPHGIRYDVESDQWAPMSAVGEPSPRVAPYAPKPFGSTWTLWGGFMNGVLSNGARYDAAADAWAPMADAPHPMLSAAVAALPDGRVIALGSGAQDKIVSSAYVFDPALDQWSDLPTDGWPGPLEIVYARYAPQSDVLLVWGVIPGTEPPELRGGRFSVASSVWSPMSREGALPPLASATLVGAEQERLVMLSGDLDTPQRRTMYDVASDSWSTLPDSSCAPPKLYAASVTGVETAEASFVVVWGGTDSKDANAAPDERGYVLRLP